MIRFAIARQEMKRGTENETAGQAAFLMTVSGARAGAAQTTPEEVAPSVSYTPDIRHRTVVTSSFLQVESAG
jgi:hypothetical protein